MKKFFTFAFVLVLILLFVSCTLKTESFSWKEIESNYSGIDEPGIIHNGFVNTQETEIYNSKDALKLAQNEHKLQKDEAYSIFYDKLTDMWKISFFPNDDNTDGGCVDVYLSGKGITELIVAGE